MIKEAHACSMRCCFNLYPFSCLVSETTEVRGTQIRKSESQPCVESRERVVGGHGALLLKWRSMQKNTTNKKESYKPLWPPEEPHSQRGWSREGCLVGKRFPIALRKYYLFVREGEVYGHIQMSSSIWLRLWQWPSEICLALPPPSLRWSCRYGPPFLALTWALRVWTQVLELVQVFDLENYPPPSLPRAKMCVCSYSLELWGGWMLCMHKTSTLKHISG